MKEPYKHSKVVHNKKSAEIVVPFLIELFNPASVIDIGCGLGDWLKVFQDNGVTNILGIDGSWVNKNDIYIDTDKFFEADLSRPLNINQSFDLCICLEVAEHLPKSAADTLVDSLIGLSDKIIFSAAIPCQGGQNHINEQWQEYWSEKFEERGFYCHDIIRPFIWNNSNVEWWYKQNCFYFSKEKNKPHHFRNAVHPGLLLDKQNHFRNIRAGKLGIRLSFKIFINSIYNFLQQ